MSSVKILKLYSIFLSYVVFHYASHVYHPLLEHSLFHYRVLCSVLRLAPVTACVILLDLLGMCVCAVFVLSEL